MTLYTTAPYLLDLGIQIDPMQRLAWVSQLMSVQCLQVNGFFVLIWPES